MFRTDYVRSTGLVRPLPTCKIIETKEIIIGTTDIICEYGTFLEMNRTIEDKGFTQA